MLHLDLVVFILRRREYNIRGMGNLGLSLCASKKKALGRVSVPPCCTVLNLKTSQKKNSIWWGQLIIWTAWGSTTNLSPSNTRKKFDRFLNARRHLRFDFSSRRFNFKLKSNFLLTTREEGWGPFGAFTSAHRRTDGAGRCASRLGRGGTSPTGRLHGAARLTVTRTGRTTAGGRPASSFPVLFSLQPGPGSVWTARGKLSVRHESSVGDVDARGARVGLPWQEPTSPASELTRVWDGDVFDTTMKAYRRQGERPAGYEVMNTRSVRDFWMYGWIGFLGELAWYKNGTII